MPIGLMGAPDGHITDFGHVEERLYLVHMVLTQSTYAWLDAQLGIGQWSKPLQIAVYLPVFTTLSIVASLVLHYVIEKPFLLLKDRVGESQQGK